MIDTLARWRATEPVRLYLYGVGAATVAVLVARGVVTGYDAPMFTALLHAVLLAPAVEGARARVTSPATADALAERLREQATAPTTAAGARGHLLAAADDLDHRTGARRA